jgi:hypothetical protein
MRFAPDGVAGAMREVLSEAFLLDMPAYRVIDFESFDRPSRCR